MIILDQICKHYKNPNTNVVNKVLNDISMHIVKDDSMAIVGPSGSGKSTLLNIIGTLDVPTSGIIKYQEQEVNGLNDKQLSELRNKNIGFVFQMHHLLPQLNVLENVLLPVIPNSTKQQKQQAMDRAIGLLEQVGLKNNIHQFSGQLSGGECQRVAVVRALINEPEIILADEPTGSLDQKSAEQVGNLLVELQDKKKIALIVVTHSHDLANKMKTKYSLVNGKLVQFK